MLVGLKKTKETTDPNFEDHAIVNTDFFFGLTISHNRLILGLIFLINYLTCSTMFLVPNIDQMYKEMKKIVEVGNKHGNRDEFPNLAQRVM
jgi:hypothetical protein